MTSVDANQSCFCLTSPSRAIALFICFPMSAETAVLMRVSWQCQIHHLFRRLKKEWR